MDRALRARERRFLRRRPIAGAPLLFSTVLAANIGAGATIGAAGRGYFDGISAWWWNGSAAIGSVFLAFFIGPRVWRIAKEHNLYTTGDLPRIAVRRPGPWRRHAPDLAGHAVDSRRPVDRRRLGPRGRRGRAAMGGTIISAVVVTSYFMAGGLLSSAWVNAVQLIVLLAGFTVAVPMVLSRADLAQASSALRTSPRRSRSSFIRPDRSRDGRCWYSRRRSSSRRG